MFQVTAETQIGKAWCFSRGDGAVIAPQLRLLAGGRVALHKHNNECSWAIRDNVLVFCDDAGEVTTAFTEVTCKDHRLRFEGSFLPSSDARHILNEVEPLERLASPSETANPVARAKTRRPNLVVLRAGPGSLHHTWSRDIRPEDRTWDLCVSWYGEGADPEAEWELQQFGDRKFPALWKLFGQPSPLWHYERVMLADDDLLMSWRTINRAFEMVRQFGLAIAAPSLTPESFITHGMTQQMPGTTLRFSTFVESMAPIFSNDALRACLPTFGQTRLGFGLDHIWPQLLGNLPARLAVLDEVSMTHTRPLAAGYDVGAAMEEERILLRAFGIQPTYEILGSIVL